MGSYRGRRGGVLAGILLGILALAVLLVAGVVFIAWFFAEHVRVQETAGEHGRTVRVETPVGSVRVRERARPGAGSLGVPVYPGARLSESDSKLVNVELDFGPRSQELGITAAVYTSDDPVEKVVEFYRRQLPHWIVAQKRRGGFQMEYTEGGYKRMIAIHRDDGRTRIAIAQIGEPEEI